MSMLRALLDRINSSMPRAERVAYLAAVFGFQFSVAEQRWQI